MMNEAMCRRILHGHIVNKFDWRCVVLKTEKLKYQTRCWIRIGIRRSTVITFSSLPIGIYVKGLREVSFFSQD